MLAKSEFAMTSRRILQVLFSLILLGMVLVTGWASLRQPVWQWGGLHGPDAPWTWATLADAYAGFLTFFVFVVARERRLGVCMAWLIGILLLGNMAMSLYMLLALARHPANAPLSALLTPVRS
jgi:hypothetical protein